MAIITSVTPKIITSTNSVDLRDEFTPFEYALIGLANAYGKDKLLFEDRIQWAVENGRNLHKLIDSADDKPLYVRSLIEIDNIRKGKTASGHMVGLDGTASGLQMLSCLSGCIRTATNVGLIDPNRRADAYTDGVHVMNQYLVPSKQIILGKSDEGALTRNDFKDAMMTHYYGSVGRPLAVFGDGTPELKAFYLALREMNPGAEDLMECFIDCIDNLNRLKYSWTLPDNFEVICNVIAETTKTVTIDELPNASGNASTISHIYKHIGRNDDYVAVPANGTHSVDALVVREMKRRLGHDKEQLAKAYSMVKGSHISTRENFVSLRMADWIVEGREDFTESQAGQLAEVIESVMDNESAPMVTVHDEFKTYPRSCGAMRQNYVNILAEIADSNLAQQMLRDMYEDQSIMYHKQSGHEQLSSMIRKSRYAIC